jgi:hypothetical protein
MFVGVEALGAFEGQAEVVAGRLVRDSRRCCCQTLSRATVPPRTLEEHPLHGHQSGASQPRRFVESLLSRNGDLRCADEPSPEGPGVVVTWRSPIARECG